MATLCFFLIAYSLSTLMLQMCKRPQISLSATEASLLKISGPFARKEFAAQHGPFQETAGKPAFGFAVLHFPECGVQFEVVSSKAQAHVLYIGNI